MYKLVIQDDEGKTTVVPLIRDELTIGRKEGNTIRLTERNVSRKHARLVRANGSIAIEDLNSYNGIRVNGTRIQGRTSIKESDRVQIGDYLIEIKAEAQDKPETAPARPGAIAGADGAAPEPLSATDPSAQTTNRISAESAAVAGDHPTTDSMALGETDPAGAALTATGRLVALSTRFAGEEFNLDKPSIVIGRTDDNDVCLNHRSISRHHAKIVRENGRYAIVDLQSSNGVRVNGEEYGKVELRRGDLVDLGHVRLRFVEPGEDFLFGRDAQAVEMETEGGSRAILWIGLALLAIAAAAALFLFKGGGDREQGRSTAASGAVRAQGGEAHRSPVAPAASAVAIDPAGPADAGVAIAPVASPPTPTDDVGKHLDLGRQAIAGERWQVALDEAHAALAIDPHQAAASSLAAQAASELAQQAIYADFTRAATAHQLARAHAVFAKLDADSVYRVRAQAQHDQLKAEYLALQGEAGRKLAERGRCRDQRKLALEAERVWGAEAKQAVLATACKEASSGAPAGGASSGGGDTAQPAADEATATDAGPGADDLLTEAREAAKEDQFGKALRLCQGALGKRPGDSEAAQICVIAACNLKSEATAKKYLDKVKSASRVQALKQICLGKGVDIN